MNSAAAVLGVLASGRAVIPLDADHPEARNRLIADRSAAAGVVTISALAGQARALVDAEAVVEIDRLDACADFAPRPRPDDLAYILYTSGSTGAPKGVFQNHRSLLTDLLHSVQGFELGPEDRAGLFYPPAVAAGLRALLGTLLSGATAHLLAPLALGARGLVQEIRNRRITVLRSSATLFRGVVDAAGDERLESLRLVALGGDRVDWSDYDAFRRVCRPEACLMDRSAEAALDPVTAEIGKAFETILRLEGVTSADNLLSLGGDSLQAVDIALELGQRLGVPIAPELLDMSCAIGELADRLGLRGEA